MADKKAHRQLRYSEMQRDIRFRAWDTKVKSMYKLQTIDMPWPYIDVILMQYTGVKDKAGREIWQDDLIKDSSGRVCTVKWHKCIVGWDAWDDVKVVFMGKDKKFNPHNWPDSVEVIGNIHEGVLCVK